MDQDVNFSLPEFAFAVRRRQWTFLLVSLMVLILGMLYIAKIPVMYRSTGVILIEQQEIPTQWVNSTVASFAEERIRTIGQRVLSTAKLESIINRFNLFPDLRGKLTSDQLVELARSNFSIENVEAQVRDRLSGGRNFGTVAIQISYQDSSAEVARDVASELVSLYLQENLKARAKAATGTRVFLESEADRLERELAQLENNISEFKERNVGTLPEHQEINIQAYERVEQKIADIDREISSLDERHVIISTGIASARRILQADQAGTETTEVIDPTQQRLEQLRAQYVTLQTRYSAYHPDLIRLRQEIGLLESQVSPGAVARVREGRLQILSSQLVEAKNKYSDEHPEVMRLEREIALLNESSSETVALLNTGLSDSTGVDADSSNSGNASSLQQDSALIALQTDLQSAINEQRSARGRKAELIAKLAELELRINKTPEVEREYRSLIRDHENIQDKYNDIRAKQNSAKVAESLETEQKGERFTLIESPHAADHPYSPNHKKLFLFAIGFALMGGLGSVFGLEIIDARVRNIQSLETLTGVPVLATVGVIENRKDRLGRILKLVFILLLVGGTIGGILYLMYRYEISPGELRPGLIFRNLNEWVANNEMPEDLWHTFRNWITN